MPLLFTRELVEQATKSRVRQSLAGKAFVAGDPKPMSLWVARALYRKFSARKDWSWSFKLWWTKRSVHNLAVDETLAFLNANPVGVTVG